MTEITKFGVSVPAWVAEELEVLAKINGTARATLAATVICAYIQYSFKPEMRDIRDRMLEAIASRRGITVEQLIQEWLNEES